MNDEDTINDLKQFIATTVGQQISQQTDELRGEINRLDKRIDSLDTKLDTRIDEVLAAVGDAMENRIQPIEEDVQQLNARVSKLESA